MKVFLKSVLQTYIFFLIVSLLLGCKKYTNDIEVDQIYQYYILRYSEQTNETTVYAYLSENDFKGKSILLGEGSTLRVNNKNMSKSGRHYYTVFSGMIDSALIEFHDSRGVDFINTIYNEDHISNDNTNILSKSINSTWFFSGTPIHQGELVELSLKVKSNSSLDALLKSSEVGENFIYVPFSSLKDLTEGVAIAQTIRSSQNFNGNWTVAGGKKKSEFYSTLTEVNILE